MPKSTETRPEARSPNTAQAPGCIRDLERGVRLNPRRAAVPHVAAALDLSPRDRMVYEVGARTRSPEPSLAALSPHHGSLRCVQLRGQAVPWHRYLKLTAAI